MNMLLTGDDNSKLPVRDFTTVIATTILWPLYKSACVSQRY